MSDEVSGGLVGAIPPPPGVTPNFVDPEWNGSQLNTLCLVFSVVSTLVVLMRIYTRWLILRIHGPEEWTIALAQLCNLVFTAMVYTLNRIGSGKHLWDILLSDFSPNFLLYFAIQQPVYTFAIMFAKLSVLLFYLGLSPEAPSRAFILVLIFVILASYVPLAFITVLGCSPVAKLWDLSITSGQCIDHPVLYVTGAAINVATDAALLVLPIPLIRSLHVSFKQKLGLALIFATGAFVSIVSCIRLAMVLRFLHETDITWLNTVAESWTVTETHIAIICACLPFARPFCRYHFPRFFGALQLSPAASSSLDRSTKGYARSRSPAAPWGPSTINTTTSSSLASSNTYSYPSRSNNSSRADHHPTETWELPDADPKRWHTTTTTIESRPAWPHATTGGGGGVGGGITKTTRLDVCIQEGGVV